ncbi:MAG TPA: curli-like amyloid fiber formation chaperone CsgH [Allosphingosinicella sp.]|jgi:hypothetical protein
MFKLLGAMTAMASLISGEGADRAQAPVYLVAEPSAGGVRVQVLGKSDAPYEGVFSLDVEAGGNVSRHRGSVTLGGGEHVTLSTVTVGLAPAAAWRATLRVEPKSGSAYEQVRTSE